jgi:hypothetical protein
MENNEACTDADYIWKVSFKKKKQIFLLIDHKRGFVYFAAWTQHLQCIGYKTAYTFMSIIEWLKETYLSLILFSFEYKTPSFALQATHLHKLILGDF